jgi:very-short-patch-repair endonuclease
MQPKSIFNNILSSVDRKKLKYVGIKKTLKPRTNFTSLERKYYLMLKDMNIFYVAQYSIGGRFYDAYLPDQNVLLEFDGDFWHKEREEDCKYDFQLKGMKVDKLKNKMAMDRGIKMIRIKESEPVTSEQLKKLIWG